MKRLLIVIIGICVVVAITLLWRSGQATAPAPTKAFQTSANAATKFDKTTFSTTNTESPWVIVNKKHPIIPVTYAPNDLRKPNVPLRVPGATEMQLRDEAATALEEMFMAANAEGIHIQVSTAYRGYDYQKTLYDGYVASEGQDTADSVSARPGYSEHQTGWAVDIRSTTDTCGLEVCFGDTPEGKWLAANAHAYGYHLRYPKGKEAITGYGFEPWHFRYVGTSLSQELHTKQIKTLEDFFNVTGGAEY